MDPLDDYLSSIKVNFGKPKKLLPVLREAYTIGIPVLIAKSMTDRLGESGGFTFHLGTTDPQMRRIASWLFTNFSEKRRGLAKIMRLLWERGGREDFKLVGLIIANLDEEDLGDGVWLEFFTLVNIRSTHSLESLLEIIEEIHRTRPTPDSSVLLEVAKLSDICHQAAVLVAYVGKNNNPLLKEMFRDAPKGGEVFERVRERLLI